MKRKLLSLALIGVLTIGMVGCSKNKTQDKDIKITLILDEGGVNDQSFNQLAWEGAKKAKDNLGVDVKYLESEDEADYMQNIETAIDMQSDLIIGVGFKLTDAIEQTAKAYPEQNFAIIDGTYDEVPQNVQSLLFNEEQAGYLVGLIAGKLTETNKIAFLGGMNIPSCANFGVGFKKGAEEVNKNINVITQFTNSFTDATKAKVMAQQLFTSQNVDIIFTASGGGNMGVYEVAREINKKVIAVDMAQNYILPDHIITSALKNIDTAVVNVIKEVKENNFEGGKVVMFDLSNRGVTYEDTKHITDEIKNLIVDKTK